MKDSLLQWWKSEWGPGPLVSIALPLMISAGFISLTLFTDRTLLYWHSEQSAAAAMGGGALYWTILCLPLGLLGYISAFVSQYKGAEKFSRIGAAYQHTMRLAWAIVPIFLLLIVGAYQIFYQAGHDPKLAELEAYYLRILLSGGICSLFYSVQSGLLTGEGRTKTVLVIDGIASALNLLLDFVLIFGFGPIPAMGVIGAAIATSSSFCLKIPIAAWVIRKDRRIMETYQVGRSHASENGLYKRILYYGTPAGLQMLAESGCFCVILLQVGDLGEMEMAATTLALGLNVLAFVPMIGLGIGVGVMVGQHLTSNRLELARRTVSCAIGVTVAYTGFFAGLLWFFPNWMISIYEWGTPIERFEAMQPLLVPLLRIIAIYCILDGLQVVFVGAIKGAGDTVFVLATTASISVVAVVCGLIAESLLGPSLLLWWYTIAGWVAAMGLAFATRYFSGRWETKRVIEEALD